MIESNNLNNRRQYIGHYGINEDEGMTAKILIINGPSSAGKSTLIMLLQKVLLEKYKIHALRSGIDEAYTRMPPAIDEKCRNSGLDGLWFEKKVLDGGETIQVCHQNAFARSVYNSAKIIVKVLASSTLADIILVDHVAVEEDFPQWRQALDGCEVYYMRITATTSKLEERTRQRCQEGDPRCEGSATAFSYIVDRGYVYNGTLDTTTFNKQEMVEKCLELILPFLRPAMAESIASSTIGIGNHPQCFFAGASSDQFRGFKSGERAPDEALEQKDDKKSPMLMDVTGSRLAASVNALTGAMAFQA